MKENSCQKIFETINLFCDINNKIILEIGCGNGRISSLLADKAKKLFGIDPDAGKIHEARNNLPSCNLIIGSGESICFPNELFDLVIFTLSLHHQNSEMAIEEANRVLKKEGLILVIEPLIEGEVERIFALVYNENQAKLNAQKAIIKSGLHVEGSKMFNAHWVFDSKEELYESIFNYYDMELNATTVQNIYEHLGDKAENKPLELTDRMVILSLSKKG